MPVLIGARGRGQHHGSALAGALQGSRLNERLFDRQPAIRQNAAATKRGTAMVVSILFRHGTRPGRLRKIPARFCEAHLADRFAELELQRSHVQSQRNCLRQSRSCTWVPQYLESTNGKVIPFQDEWKPNVLFPIHKPEKAKVFYEHIQKIHAGVDLNFILCEYDHQLHQLGRILHEKFAQMAKCFFWLNCCLICYGIAIVSSAILGLIIILKQT